MLKLAAFGSVGGMLASGCSSAHAVASSIVTSFGPWPCRPTSTSMSLWMESELGSGVDGIATDPSGVEHVATFEALGDGLALATFADLVPDTEYVFRVAHRSGGSFRTMPEPNGVVRIAFGADIHPASKPYVAFDTMRAMSPHLFVGLGDHVYADLDPEGPVGPTRAEFDALYRRVWDDGSLKRAFADVPSLLVWDDHELTNDYDGSYAFDDFAAGREAYAHFQHSRSPGNTAWSVVDAGPVSVFVLDTRSFRSPNGSPDGPAKTMLGSTQKQALFNWLGSAGASLRIVASPTPFHTYVDTGPDSFYGGFATERAEILAAFDAHDPARLAVASGDLHWPSVVVHKLPSGADLVEFGCTPIAAFPRVPPQAVGADVLYVDGSVNGFGIVTFDGGMQSLDYRFIDALGNERFRYSR